MDIHHDGTVVDSINGVVRVKIISLSACATCGSHAHCGFAEKKEKVIEVDTPDWHDYAPGQRVDVIIRQDLGMQAVVIAYLLPAVLGLALFFSLYYSVGELTSALATLAFFALYACVLWSLRHRLQRRFTFQLSHLDA